MSTNGLRCFNPCYHVHLHLTLNREGRWGTTDDFTTIFFHFILFSTALWDPLNSRPVHSLIMSSRLCLPGLLPLSLCLARWFGPDLMNGKHDHTTAVYVSLRWAGGLRVVRSEQLRRLWGTAVTAILPAFRIALEVYFGASDTVILPAFTTTWVLFGVPVMITFPAFKKTRNLCTMTLSF